MELHLLLQRSKLTNGLTEEDVEKLISIAEMCEFSEGETIISETSRARDLFLIDHGSVSITMSNPIDDDKSEMMDKFHPGKILGEISFIDGSPRSATVIADDPTKLYIFNYEKLSSEMEKDKEFGYRLLRSIACVLTEKVRNTNLAWRNLMMC